MRSEPSPRDKKGVAVPEGEKLKRGIEPTPTQANVETMFPAIARYVRGYGSVEIGDQESFGYLVRAIGHGGLDFEDDREQGEDIP